MQVPVTNDILQAAKIIREGRIVAFPTGTSYGLSVDALQGHAVQRLRNLKKRHTEKTFTVFLHPNLWDRYLAPTDEERRLLVTMAGQPLTVLVRAREELEHLSREGRVGVRVIDHPIMQRLAESLDIPLTATSANKSNNDPCFTPECIQKTFPWQLDESTYDLSLGCILDGGRLPKNPPTTIIQLAAATITVVRQGALSAEMVRKALT